MKHVEKFYNLSNHTQIIVTDYFGKGEYFEVIHQRYIESEADGSIYYRIYSHEKVATLDEANEVIQRILQENEVEIETEFG